MAKKGNKIDDLKALVNRLRRDYAGDPNIRSIGWGSKKAKGTYTKELCVIFYVKKKLLTPNAITNIGSKPIPDKIDNFPTDIEQVNPGVISAGNRDETKFDPLIGGIASSNAEGHIYWFNDAGTLGMLVRSNSDNAPMALSNWHVWADGGDEGDSIIQPGHPTAGDHIEGIGKVAACGPLLTSIIEWEAPSPLAAGLYGGAAGAAVAAALSDYKDPPRRGQEKTPTDPGEFTQQEIIDVAIEYPQLPLPGVPFQTKVNWTYARETDKRVLTHEVIEERTNTQFLLGKLVTTDKDSYLPGETINIIAGIWDYQPRPCDAYHVVAHLLPHHRPEQSLRVVLQPTTCPRNFPKYPPEDEEQEICVNFEKHKPGRYPYKGIFEWLNYVNASQKDLRIVDWWEGTHTIQMDDRLVLMHAPATKVTAKVAQFTSQPVAISAYNTQGVLVGQATAPIEQGKLHELSITGSGIVRIIISGGGGEGLLVEYCITPSIASELTIPVNEVIATGIVNELTHFKKKPTQLIANRCCFGGHITLPPDEQPGKWDVHLTVQNVNNVPEGTKPEVAAATIGGHVISQHASADILGCTVIMLLDHAFDVI